MHSNQGNIFLVFSESKLSKEGTVTHAHDQICCASLEMYNSTEKH